MQELQEWLKQCGFDHFSPILDGKVKRFSRDGQGRKDCWFIGFENRSTKDGKPFHVCFAGDWGRPDEEFKFTTPLGGKEKYSREDQKAIREQIARAAKLRAEQLREQNLAVSQEAEAIWAEAQSLGTAPYLERKKMAHLYGARLRGTTVLVPMRDLDGKLWGIQRIYPEKNAEGCDKFYLKGQRVQGLFHVIGAGADAPERIWFVEGFATGASVFEATGQMTVVCFTAGELERVALAWREKYPHTLFVFAGDDDRWKETGNTGREKAEAAAKRVYGHTLFPQFKDAATKPTDWNDLHALEGLAEVKRQLSVDFERVFLHCLGHAGPDYFYTSSSNQQIMPLSKSGHGPSALLDLMPKEYWETQFPGDQGDIDWLGATSALMERCRRQGIFTFAKVRGLGAWLENGELTLHLGDRIWRRGRETKLQAVRSDFTYMLGRRLPGPHPQAATLDECRILVDAVHAANWTDKAAPYLTLGWLALSRLCGAFPWRPMLWLTGGAGSGKSRFIESVVKKATGDFGLYPMGETTGAGVRQKLQNDARPVVFDESETNNKESARRIQQLLSVIRLSSSEGDGEVYKGTPEGRSHSFKCKSTFFLASTRVNLVEEADQTRFSVVELSQAGRRPWLEVRARYDAFTRELGEKIFARSVAMYPVMLQNKAILEPIIAALHNERFADQNGTLLAAYASLVQDEPLGMSQAHELVASLGGLKSVVVTNDEADELECQNHLLGASIVVDAGGGMGAGGREPRLVGELLSDAATTEMKTLRSELQRHGLDVDSTHYYVAKNNAELSKIFTESRWVGLWAKSLVRLPGAEPAKHRFGGRGVNQVHCVKIPLSGREPMAHLSKAHDKGSPF